MSFLIDAHCHLADADYDADRSEILAGLGEAGLLALIAPGSDLESSRRALALAQREERVFACVGIHPHEAESYGPAAEASLRKWALKEKVVAIGEIGLDYHYDLAPRRLQQEVFERQLALAEEVDLPVVIHCREAAQDALPIVKSFPRLRFLMHSFTDGLEAWKPFEALGAYVSYGGMVTFKNAEAVRNQARGSDLDRILLETDGPYLAPVPKRGQMNRPEWIRYSASKLAQVLGVASEELAQRTTANSLAFYGLTGWTARLSKNTRPVGFTSQEAPQ